MFIDQKITHELLFKGDPTQFTTLPLNLLTFTLSWSFILVVFNLSSFQENAVKSKQGNNPENGNTKHHARPLQR